MSPALCKILVLDIWTSTKSIFYCIRLESNCLLDQILLRSTVCISLLIHIILRTLLMKRPKLLNISNEMNDWEVELDKNCIVFFLTFDLSWTIWESNYNLCYLTCWMLFSFDKLFKLLFSSLFIWSLHFDQLILWPSSGVTCQEVSSIWYSPKEELTDWNLVNKTIRMKIQKKDSECSNSICLNIPIEYKWFAPSCIVSSISI